ncbi:MAG TPA: NAD(P)-binding domain-containing protein, partial [Acidimicrobiales bacterium]|nr:NAD(P)-binding domain-containing protein [Acidimicrobiales bacterium]
MTPRLQVLGGGKMGEALVAGLLAAGWATEPELAVVEKYAPRRDELTARWPGLLVSEEPVAAAGVIVAVKPNDVETACRAAAAAGVERALSIAAGVRLTHLEAWLGEGVPVVRAMPNTPATVGAGAAAIAGGASATDD